MVFISTNFLCVEMILYDVHNKVNTTYQIDKRGDYLCIQYCFITFLISSAWLKLSENVELQQIRKTWF